MEVASDCQTNFSSISGDDLGSVNGGVDDIADAVNNVVGSVFSSVNDTAEFLRVCGFLSTMAVSSTMSSALTDSL